MELKIRNNVEGLGAEALSWKEETLAPKSHKGNSQKYVSLLHGELKRRGLGIKNHQKPIGLSEFEPGNPWKACFSLRKQEASRTCFQKCLFPGGNWFIQTIYKTVLVGFVGCGYSLVGGNKQVYANLCYWIPFMTEVGRTCAHPVSGGCNMCIYMYIYICIGIYTYRYDNPTCTYVYYIYLYLYRHIVKNMPMLIKQTHAHTYIYIHIYNVHHRSIYWPYTDLHCIVLPSSCIHLILSWLPTHRCLQLWAEWKRRKAAWQWWIHGGALVKQIINYNNVSVINVININIGNITCN